MENKKKYTSISNKIGFTVALGMVIAMLIVGIYSSVTLRSELIRNSKESMVIQVVSHFELEKNQ